MPSPDDFSVQIPVTADIDPVLREMDAATAKAAQKGQEAGQAYSQGVALGAANGGVGGGINGPGLGGAAIGGVGTNVAGAGVSAAAAAAGAPPGAVPVVIVGGGSSGGGSGGGLAPPGSGGVFDAAATGLLINQAMEVFKKFEGIGEIIGKAIFEGIKQNRELELADKLNSQLADRQDATQRQFESDSVSGNKTTQLTTLQDQRSALLKQNRDIEKRYAGTAYEYLDMVLDVPGAEYSMIMGERFVGPMQRQDEAQKAENEKRIFAISNQIKAIQASEMENSTGGIAGSITGENGVGRGAPLSRSEAAGYRAQLEANPEMAHEAAMWLKKSYAQQQEEIINRSIPRHTPIR